MAEEPRGSRALQVLATLLVLSVVGLAVTLAVLKYRKGRTNAPPQNPTAAQPNTTPPRKEPGDEKLTFKERLRALTQAARAAEQEHDDSEAYENWRKAHELAPEDTEIAAMFETARERRDFDLLKEQGEAALFVEDSVQACVYFEKAHDIRPKDEKINERLAFCNYWKCKNAAQAAEDKKDWKTALEQWKKALTFNPQSEDVKKKIAEVEKQLGLAGTQGAGNPKPPDPVPPVAGNLDDKVMQLQDKINTLDKEKKIESLLEAEKHCAELVKLLEKWPDKVKKVNAQASLIADKRAGYEKLYAARLNEAKEALHGNQQRPPAPGLAFSLAQALRGVYKRDTAEVDALMKEAQQATVSSDLVFVSGDIYHVGSDDPKDGNPRRTMTVGGFFMDRREVTNVQYKAFVDATGYRPPMGWTEGRYPQGQDHYPVVGVSYEDAEKFAQWAGRRLPTEAEWEVAASGGQPRRYPWGDEFLPDHANTKEGGRTGPTVGGSQPDGKSPFGAFDMVGNVAEWVQGTAPSPEEPTHLQHIAKGGSFAFPADLCTVASRRLEEGNVRLYDVGFRTVADATPEAIQKWKEAHPPQPPDARAQK